MAVIYGTEMCPRLEEILDCAPARSSRLLLLYLYVKNFRKKERQIVVSIVTVCEDNLILLLLIL